ncbi:MAG: serine acetyltransferase [Gammaproteobacteria bacterium]|nr:serine acetyltransferase [Gammaproteobacteria bacterium]
MVEKNIYQLNYLIMSKINDAIKKTSLELGDRCLIKDSYYSLGLKEETKNFIRFLRASLYPEVFAKRCDSNIRAQLIEEYLNSAYDALSKILPVSDSELDLDELATKLFIELPKIKEILEDDILAAYDGDPAAKSIKEIVLSYPGFEAISIYRLAHFFYLNKAYVLSRMMSEMAHSFTGIDIHPGANIGKRFFIDHGTGTVIGETCNIGNNVKIYQGVTLGALSFPKDEDGNIIKGTKRHPDVGDNVVIYANATILGGDTKIGDGTIIPGNTWLTHSVNKEDLSK